MSDAKSLDALGERIKSFPWPSCGDGNCLWTKTTGGQHTNCGCLCFRVELQGHTELRHFVQRLGFLVRDLIADRQRLLDENKKLWAKEAEAREYKLLQKLAKLEAKK